MRLVVALLLAICPIAAASPDSLAVLFVGNSHVHTNDLPGMFSLLAQAGAKHAMVDMSAPGGFWLEQHVVEPQTLEKIALGTWDYVALQEQSQVPVIEHWRFNSMYPSIRTLDSMIQDHGCSTALYMTWGWQDGGIHELGGHTSPEFRDYFHMQDSVSAAYRMIATELGARLSPVGEAWAVARRRDPLVELWQSDKCHATVKGTYLAACTFYAALFESSPVGLNYTAGLDTADARFLQLAAERAVLVVSESEPPALSPAAFTARPNPFKQAVTLKGQGLFSVRIQDLQGRVVRHLEAQGSVLWDGTNSAGHKVPAGVYFAEPVPRTSPPQRLVLLR
ncbi:MAG: hypothetical protein JSU73_13895 [candidate division WOR-3 bacterium]|nr:MAG: hypothetical protein JSU73_13895 [candidate division WOR-3 bacterium]